MVKLFDLLRRRQAGPVIQFCKYGVCGGFATLVYVLVVYLLTRAFPERVSELLDDRVRAGNLALLQALAFVPATVVAYLLNRAFVFTPGRHPTHREFALFLAVAIVSSGVGLLATDLLIRIMAVPNWQATAASVIGSVLVNFAARKLIIFAS